MEGSGRSLVSKSVLGAHPDMGPRRKDRSLVLALTRSRVYLM